MKIKMEKEFIAAGYTDQVKADMKEFKERFTDNDLMLAFNDAFANYARKEYVYGEVIKCDVSAFTAGYLYDEKTTFRIDMIVDGFDRIYRIWFYCDVDLMIDTNKTIFGDDMHKMTVYTA